MKALKETESLSSKEYFGRLFDVTCSTEVTQGHGEGLTLDNGLWLGVKAFLATKKNGGRVYLIGNGGSTAITSHAAIDLWNAGGVPSTTFNETSLLTCIGNDYGYENVFKKPIEMFFKQEDLLVAVSSSGKSANILRGAEAAKNLRGRVITFSGFDPANALRSIGFLNFYCRSSQYGEVEISHAALIHCMTDSLMREKRRSEK